MILTQGNWIYGTGPQKDSDAKETFLVSLNTYTEVVPFVSFKSFSCALWIFQSTKQRAMNASLVIDNIV